MTENIVPFPSVGDECILYVCSCSCMSFFINDGGTVECCNCGEIHIDHADGVPPGEWVTRLPPDTTSGELTDAGALKMTNVGTAEFAMRRTMGDLQKWATTNELVAVAGYNREGQGKLWFGIETQEQKDWCIRKLSDMLEQLQHTKVTE